MTDPNVVLVPLGGRDVPFKMDGARSYRLDPDGSLWLLDGNGVGIGHYAAALIANLAAQR
jgi:hypothetical protein